MLYSGCQRRECIEEKLESFEMFSKLSITDNFHWVAYSLSDIQIPSIWLVQIIFSCFFLFYTFFLPRVGLPYSSFGESIHRHGPWVITHLLLPLCLFGLSLRPGAGIHICILFIVSHSTYMFYFNPGSALSILQIFLGRHTSTWTDPTYCPTVWIMFFLILCCFLFPWCW